MAKRVDLSIGGMTMTDSADGSKMMTVPAMTYHNLSYDDALAIEEQIVSIYKQFADGMIAKGKAVSAASKS